MNVEQRVYIKSLVGNPVNQQFDQFIRNANLHTLIKAFETRIQTAWKQFVQQNVMIRPSGSGADAYQKMQLRDFGASDSAPPLLQNNPLLDHLAKPPPLSHSSQALASAMAASASSQHSSHPSSTPPVSASTTGSPPAPASDASNTTPSTAPNAQGAAPTPPSPTIPPASAVTPPKSVVAPEPPKTPPPPAIRFTIGNARQNKSFEGEILREPNIPGLRLVDVMLPEDSGLGVDLEHWRITGTPAIGGEFKLGLRYAFANEPAQVSHTAGMPFVINADPKTLWKDLPSDRATPYWKEDSASSIVLGKQARIVAARKRGRSHAHKGTCCDDDYALQCDDESGWHVAIVADGAGSAKFSRRGSQVATRAVTSYMKEVFADERGASLIESIEALAQLSADPATASDALDQARRATLIELYKTLGHAAHAAVRELHAEMKAREDIITSVKDLSTTLLIGIARKVGSQWFCAAYWVGDGAIAVYRRNQSVQLLGAPDSGEFSGQTHFLDANQVSQDALLRRLRFELVEDMTAFLLMTDGVSDPKFRSDVAMGQTEEWDRLWDELEADVRLSGDEDGVETRLLDWLDFWAQGEYDDRTLAIIY